MTDARYYRTKVEFPESNTKKNCYIKATSRMAVKHFVHDKWHRGRLAYALERGTDKPDLSDEAYGPSDCYDATTDQ